VSVAAVALTLALTAAPTAPAPTSTAPPGVDWQDGRVVHHAGRTLRLPAQVPAYAEVLGQRGGEWYVVVPGNAPRVLAVDGSRVRTVWRHAYDEAATSYSLGGSYLLEWNVGRAGERRAVAVSLAGRRIAARRWPGSSYPLAATAREVLVHAGTDTLAWRPGSAPRRVAPAAVWASTALDVAFLDLGDDLTGPTSLRDPGVPAWTARFSPVAVSPSWAAGTSPRGRLQVRSLADGTLAALPAYRVRNLAWEDVDTLLVETADGIVRCELDGTCEEAAERGHLI
jgi:hypothetical protein